MQNPWINLSYEGLEYVLLEDKAPILEFNETRKREENKFHLEVPPEPYLGNPDAPVVVLAKCPGYMDEDKPFMLANEHFRTAMKNTLLHQSQEFPIYYLNPTFRTSPGANYWIKKMKGLLEFRSLRSLANNIFILNYFPYKCKTANSFPTIPSIMYSKYLLEKAMARQAVIILSSGTSQWHKITNIENYPYLITPNSQITGSLGPGNFSNVDFDIILNNIR